MTPKTLQHCNKCMNYLAALLLIINVVCISPCHSKYVEGHLKTLDDWAFLSRFCFISGKGRYEYYIEFERRYGEPQLLLYYDDVSQWPAVYKTQTTCQQKLSVLSTIDNQIVTLSARSPYNMMSGCTLKAKNPNAKPPLDIVTPAPPATADPTYFDHFLKATTDMFTATSTNGYEDMENSTGASNRDSGSEFDSEFENFNFTGFNETDVFNVSAAGSSGLMGDPLFHDTGYRNRLENGTDFMIDVEQLFDGGDAVASVRMRRHLPMPVNFKREGKGTILVTCSNIGGFTSSRERWWYIAIANCGSGKGLDITYRFRMTNGPPGDFWHEHFSADEMFIPPILLAESLTYTFMLVAVFICSLELKALHLLHCTYRLFSFSVMLQWLGVLLQGISWTTYGLTGLGPKTMLGGMFMGASEVSFLTLVLLLAKGYTITRARLSSSSTIKLTIFVNVYIVVYLSLYIFQAETFDPGEVLNLYESPAGFGLAGLRIGAWGAFVISTVTTIKKYPEKTSFYYPFGALGSLWILGGPLTTVFGIAVLDAWVRESIVCFVLAALAVGGHASFLYLTWPSRANKSFPYHVRTNHVGVISDEDDGIDYPRHTYEPSLADQNTIIPLSRRTEELLNGVYGQYLIDQLNTNPSSNHISFPRSPSAPPMAGHPDEQSTAMSPNNKPSHQQLLHRPAASALQHQHSDDIEQVDSGHPSLETSTASPNDTVPPSAEETPKVVRKVSVDDGVLKMNPFVVNGVKRVPNKIILQPIEHPIKEPGSVPRHLFAAKNPKK